MTNPLRYAAPREPKRLDQLTRAQLAGRVCALRGALDLLAAQTELDGAVGFVSRGALKGELTALVTRLGEMDRTAPGRPFSVAVAEPAARQRLTAATDELHHVLAGICADAIRSAGGVA